MDTRKMRPLGTSSKGYRYWLAEDNYVYQQLPDGTWNGWLCTIATWESHLHSILKDRKLISL